MKEQILFELKLTDAHFTEGGSNRIIFGQESKLRPEYLKIIRFDDDESLYLIEYDTEGNEIIDTFHEALESAQRQAKHDWGVKFSEWRKSLIE